MRKYWAHHAGSTGFGEPRLLVSQDRNAHRADEQLCLSDLAKATEVIALAITDLLR